MPFSYATRVARRNASRTSRTVVNATTCSNCLNYVRRFHSNPLDERLLHSIVQRPCIHKKCTPSGLPSLKSQSFHVSFSLRVGIESQSKTLPDSDDDFALPIRRTGHLDNHHNGNKNSPIRQQLRTWSEQQRRNLEENPTERGNLVFAQTDAQPINSLFVKNNHINNEDEEDDYTEEGTVATRKYNLQRGDVIELLDLMKGGSKNTVISIYIGPLGSQDLFLAEDGRWAATSAVRPKSMPIRGFVDPSTLDPLLPFVPKTAINRQSENHGMIEDIASFGDIPSDVVAPLTKQLASLRNEVLEFRREHASVIERLHELLALEDRFLVKSIDEVSRDLFDKPFSEIPRGGHLAFFHALESDPLGCQICKRPDNTYKLVLTPKRLVRQFENVREWAREYQESAAQAALGKTVSLSENPLNSFIDKARRIILESRKIRSPTTIGNLGPSTVKHRDHVEGEGMVTISGTGETFNASDQMIIEFIWNTYLRTPKVMFNTTAQSIASLILRAIGAYPSLRLEKKIARLLLQEIGAMDPWSEIADDDVVLPIPSRRNGYDANKLFEDSEQLVREMKLDISPHVLPMIDTMAHLRHESKATEVVYCIDSKRSDMLEDGFSIEEHSEIPGAHWLHIHIAHPSAFIGPDHLFAKRAAHFGSSLYTSRQFYPLFPHYFSLASCLTRGEVKEVKMAPGIVKKIVRLIDRAVDRGLGRGDPEIAFLSIGGKQKDVAYTHEADLQIVTQHLELLKTAQNICRARLDRRLVEVPEALETPYHDSNFEVMVTFPRETNSQFDKSQSRHFVGDPSIYVTSKRHETSDVASRRYLVDSLNTQLMSVCSELAALWCLQREIPAIYQASLPTPGFSPSELGNLERNQLRLKPRHQLSSTPLPHVLINCNHYMRFSSPLRRYSDIIGHWQIDAYLRQENKSPNRIIGYEQVEELPFSKAQLDEYILQNSQTIKDVDKLMRRSNTHWTYLALFRAFHFKEAALPEVWDMCIERISESNAFEENLDDTGLRGRLLPFQVNYTRLLKSPEGYEKTALLGQYLPVKIELVDVESPALFVRAVGPASDKPTTTQPIQIIPNIQSPTSQEQLELSGEAEELPRQENEMHCAVRYGPTTAGTQEDHRYYPRTEKVTEQ